MTGSEARFRALKKSSTLFWLIVPIALGTVGVLVYGFARSSTTIYIVAAAVAAAACAAGALIGFLFGIPRALTSETAPLTEPDALDPSAPQYRPNTNLEQVSDWLTKILIGVGLAQASDIVKGFKALCVALKPALGGDDAAQVFSGAMIVYFVVTGFMCAYLYTRLRLQRELEDAGERVRTRVAAAAAARASH
jgi:hypothetical protein